MFVVSPFSAKLASSAPTSLSLLMLLEDVRLDRSEALVLLFLLLLVLVDVDFEDEDGDDRRRGTAVGILLDDGRARTSSGTMDSGSFP
jgi:hypothetical protein